MPNFFAMVIIGADQDQSARPSRKRLASDRDRARIVLLLYQVEAGFRWVHQASSWVRIEARHF
jgi:hypothetical protein